MHRMVGRVPVANRAEFTFTISDPKSAGAAEAERLKVIGFSGSEGLSELFQFRIELCSDEAEIDPAQMLAKFARLSILADGERRVVHGFVRAFERVGRTADGTALFVAEIVPIHWMLTRRITCWIHQAHNTPDMSVPGIVKQVLLDAGIAPDLLRFALERDYPQREFVVQYRESEFDFIARLLEDEGIHYYFEHADDRHVMVFCDGAVGHRPISAVFGPSTDASAAELPYRTPTGLVPERDSVFAVEERHELAIGMAELDEFNFTRPGAALRSKAALPNEDALYFFDHPGKYETKEQGDIYARIRLEEFQCGRRTLQMAATARNLAPGYTFTLVEHPVESVNGEYLLTHVRHEARQRQSGEEDARIAGDELGYEVRVRTLPVAVPFRPARRTPKPIVRGSQTAIVVGPNSEEVFTDRFGRVKVQFAWDPAENWDERSSCFIRVSQGWAGGQYGFQFLPRVGHEVIVDFLEGDPDRPIITGRVYNGDLTPPFDLPDNKMISGIKTKATPQADGANALIFDDSAGNERVHLHAQRAMEFTTEGGRIDSTGGDHDISVGRDRRDGVKASYELKIGTDHNQLVGGTKRVGVNGNYHVEIGGARFEKAGNGFSLQGGPNVIVEADLICLRAGGNFITISADGIDIVGTVVNINSGGTAGVALAPASPEIAGAAGGSHVAHGYDVRYVASEQTGSGLQKSLAAPAAATPDDEKKTSWIEIELVDEAQQPWPGEPYEVTAADGTVHRGALNEKGLAHVELDAPGLCRISFPRLDQEAWRRG